MADVGLRLGDLVGSGKNKLGFDQVAIEFPAHGIVSELVVLESLRRAGRPGGHSAHAEEAHEAGVPALEEPDSQTPHRRGESGGVAAETTCRALFNGSSARGLKSVRCRDRFWCDGCQSGHRGVRHLCAFDNAGAASFRIRIADGDFSADFGAGARRIAQIDTAHIGTGTIILIMNGSGPHSQGFGLIGPCRPPACVQHAVCDAIDFIIDDDKLRIKAGRAAKERIAEAKRACGVRVSEAGVKTRVYRSTGDEIQQVGA